MENVPQVDKILLPTFRYKAVCSAENNIKRARKAIVVASLPEDMEIELLEALASVKDKLADVRSKIGPRPTD